MTPEDKWLRTIEAATVAVLIGLLLLVLTGGRA